MGELPEGDTCVLQGNRGLPTTVSFPLGGVGGRIVKGTDIEELYTTVSCRVLLYSYRPNTEHLMQIAGLFSQNEEFPRRGVPPPYPFAHNRRLLVRRIEANDKHRRIIDLEVVELDAYNATGPEDGDRYVG